MYMYQPGKYYFPKITDKETASDLLTPIKPHKLRRTHCLLHVMPQQERIIRPYMLAKGNLLRISTTASTTATR